MPTTYGERLLAEAEQRARARAHRRRAVFLLGPCVIVVLLAVRGIWTVRQGTLQLEGAGLFRQLLDHGATLLYAVVAVLGPLALALRRRLLRVPAAIALVTGPILMPVLFGPGSRWWQWLVVGLVAVLTISAARPAGRPRSTR